MARPKAVAYTLGKVTYSDHPTMLVNAGKKNQRAAKQARGYYRDDAGRRREVTAAGDTEAAARRALQLKVSKAKDAFEGGDGVLKSSTLLPAAAAIWLSTKAREELTARTLRDYTGYVERTINTGTLSNLTVLEANDIARIEAWLEGVADTRGSTAAKQARKALGGILELAERRGAIPASVMHRVKTPKATPGSTGDRKCKTADCEGDCEKTHLDTQRAFTREEAHRVQHYADQSQADIGDLSAFLFGTGARISEALHGVWWSDVDLEAKTVHIHGTKTEHADRVLAISDDLAARLKVRKERFGSDGLVFGVTYFKSKLGQPRDADNVRKAFRRVFGKLRTPDESGALVTAGTYAEVPWAGTHTYRRTVASWLDESGASLAEIANQLGHADTNVTAGYLGRRVAPTRAASVMVLPSGPPVLKAV